MHSLIGAAAAQGLQHAASQQCLLWVSGGNEKATESAVEMEEVENATAEGAQVQEMKPENATANKAGTQEMGTNVSTDNHKVEINVSGQSKKGHQSPETAASGQQLGRVEQEEVWHLMRP
jgi:hypothetical protein